MTKLAVALYVGPYLRGYFDTLHGCEAARAQLGRAFHSFCVEGAIVAPLIGVLQ